MFYFVKRGLGAIYWEYAAIFEVEGLAIWAPSIFRLLTKIGRGVCPPRHGSHDRGPSELFCLNVDTCRLVHARRERCESAGKSGPIKGGQKGTGVRVMRRPPCIA